MPNLYANLKQFKDQLLRDDSETESDDMYLDYLEFASRTIDNYVSGAEPWRHFYVWKGKRTLVPESRGRNIFSIPYNFDARSGVYYGRNSDSIIIPDLLEADKIEINSSDVTSSFNLEPRNATPKIQIAVKRSNLWTISLSSGMLPNGADVNITGKWGYSDVRTSSLTTLDGAIDDDDDSITVDDVSKLFVGMTLWLDSGSSEEQCYLSAVKKTDADDETAPIPGTLTVDRGMNGYSARSHSDGTKVYAQRFESPIRQSCIDLALRKHRGRDVEWEGQGSENEGLLSVLQPIGVQITHYRRGRMKFYGL